MKQVCNTMSRQTYVPRGIEAEDVASLGSVALSSLQGVQSYRGKSWNRYQLTRGTGFALIGLEAYNHDDDTYAFTRLESYVKVNFWLSGKHVTVLDGYGEHAHDRSEVLITGGPPRMLKVDILPRNTHVACVGLCVFPEFFATCLGLSPDEVPIPLRRAAQRTLNEYIFYRLKLTPDLSIAARAVLTASFSVRRQPEYAQAKAVELICLLIYQLTKRNTADEEGLVRRYASRLYQARELIHQNFGSALTLSDISTSVGLNRVTLTAGFRAAFGLTLSDYLRKVRMERAHELLEGRTLSIGAVANAVGYSHLCNFSTAFRGYFGHSPREVPLREGRPRS